MCHAEVAKVVMWLGNLVVTPWESIARCLSSELDVTGL